MIGENPKQEENLEMKKFDEVPEEEQIKRFKSLNSLFLHDSEAKTDEDKDISKYLNFFENVYKYIEEFKIEGLDKKEVEKSFWEAKCGNELIKKLLDFFLQVKKKIADAPNDVVSSYIEIEREMANYGHFFDSKNGKIKKEKVLSLFRWSLESFIAGGEKIGRKPHVKIEEVDQLCEDLLIILESINNYFDSVREIQFLRKEKV